MLLGENGQATPRNGVSLAFRWRFAGVSLAFRWRLIEAGQAVAGARRRLAGADAVVAGKAGGPHILKAFHGWAE
jgi:hypothetical protein